MERELKGTKKIKLGVMVSGRGSNLQAIIDAVERGELSAEIVIVVSNRAGVQALARAEARSIPTAFLETKDFPSRQEQNMAMKKVLEERRIDLVVMAGYDSLVTDDFLQAFAGRIINIHPSLLPAFGGGLHAQADAFNHGVKVAGCTVHFVTNEVDAGPIILQQTVPVLEDDTAESLAARILAEEHRLLPSAIQLFAEGRLQIEGRKVRISPPVNS